MKAWLYYRLSRDEDEEMNSLQNQRQILLDYAKQNGYEIVGESFDDNVSGMTFNRKGLGELENAVDEGKVEAVLVKDLSRLGRHRTQTALFIDHLRENNVKVISVTEGIDTTNENDDLLIGFKQIFNDFYAKDIGKKVRAGIRQKQKTGLIVNLPMGYYKDKNTGEVLVDETAIMHVEIYSREQIESVISNIYKGNFYQDLAVISFCDRGTEPRGRVDYSGVCSRVMYIEIDDLEIGDLKEEGYTYDTFFPEVNEAAEFIIDAYKNGMNIICQCEYG